MVVTLDTSHREMSPLKEFSLANKWIISVTSDTSHSAIGPCGPSEQSPSGDISRHSSTASLSSSLEENAAVVWRVVKLGEVERKVDSVRVNVYSVLGRNWECKFARSPLQECGNMPTTSTGNTIQRYQDKRVCVCVCYLLCFCLCLSACNCELSVCVHGCRPACVDPLQCFHVVPGPQNRDPGMVMVAFFQIFFFALLQYVPRY